MFIFLKNVSTVYSLVKFYNFKYLGIFVEAKRIFLKKLNCHSTWKKLLSAEYVLKLMIGVINIEI